MKRLNRQRTLPSDVPTSARRWRLAAVAFAAMTVGLLTVGMLEKSADHIPAHLIATHPDPEHRANEIHRAGAATNTAASPAHATQDAALPPPPVTSIQASAKDLDKLTGWELAARLDSMLDAVARGSPDDALALALRLERCTPEGRNSPLRAWALSDESSENWERELAVFAERRDCDGLTNIHLHHHGALMARAVEGGEGRFRAAVKVLDESPQDTDADHSAPADPNADPAKLRWAVSTIEEAARAGQPKALEKLAVLLVNGNLVEADPSRALAIFAALSHHAQTPTTSFDESPHLNQLDRETRSQAIATVRALQQSASSR